MEVIQILVVILKVLITGGTGLVGSECCRLFANHGWKIVSVDNNMRGRLFGTEGNTNEIIDVLTKEYDIEHYNIDIRDKKIIELIKNVDAIIHTASQPSHPKSIEIPLDDFQINSFGTLFLLESLRKHNITAPFIHCSTNKVYGDVPNYFHYKVEDKRFEPTDPTLWDGFDENLRIDNCLHTPFGVSKASADLYVQEYARLYGLKTGVFRMGCITGGAAKAVEEHNWESFFIKKALLNEKIRIYGHNGYQVRDVIDARDLAKLFLLFLKNPRPGEVFNIGGGRKNSISLLEALDLIESITGRKMNYINAKEREGDHKWYISNLGKIKSHYKWDIEIGLKDIFKNIHESLAYKYERK